MNQETHNLYSAPHFVIHPLPLVTVICVSPMGPSDGTTQDYDINDSYNELE